MLLQEKHIKNINEQTHKPTNKLIQEILMQNPNIPADKKTYKPCKNKIPIQKGCITLNDKLPRNTNAIALYTYKTDYFCIDIDGYSNNDKDTDKYRQEKRQTAEILKDNLIKLIEQHTKKYRLDKTASGKYHLWLKHPPVHQKLLILPKFLTSNGSNASGLIELMNKNTKHNIHLAGSTITNDDGSIGKYTNIYAGATFDKLDHIDNIINIIIGAINDAGYLTKITKDDVDKKTNTTSYIYRDANHDGTIKETHSKGKLYYSYLKNNTILDKHFYKTDTNQLELNSIEQDAPPEYKSILKSIYYYQQENQENNDDTIDDDVLKTEINEKLIDLYANYWNNTAGQRHYLILATSHVLIDHFNYNNEDLYNFFDTLADKVTIDNAHRNIIIEGFKPADTKYGIPTIINILQCANNELEFLNQYNNDIKSDLEYMERIKPTITDAIQKDEKYFQQLHQLQQNNYFDGNNTYLKIDPTSSITSLITQILGNALTNENKNIARLLLALVTVITGNGRTFILLTGVSSGGKSAIVEIVKKAIPERYILDIDDSSEKAFMRYVENKGNKAYDRIIIDSGDKGAIKEFEKNKETMGAFQSLITKGSYTYQVTNQTINGFSGTIDLTVDTTGFTQIITTVKDVIANLDEQILSRSELLHVANNTYDDISDFLANAGMDNVIQEVYDYSNLIKSHILYNLNKHNTMDIIIVKLWHDYFKDLLQANNGIQRQIEFTMNAFKSYCWLEIHRLHQIKGVDGVIYYIPDSDLVDDFVELYGVKSSKIHEIDKAFIEWLKDKYDAIDIAEMDADNDKMNKDLNKRYDRKDANVFTYKDIDTQLKMDDPELYAKINNISELLKKLYKENIIQQHTEKTNNRNLIYYIPDTSQPENIDTNIIPISDANINYAIDYLRNHARIKQDDNDRSTLFKKSPLKFSSDTDFSFIDKRGKDDIIKNDDMNDDNNNNNDNDIDNVDNVNHDGNINNVDAVNVSGSDTTDNITSTDTPENTNNPTPPETSQLVNLHCHTDESVGDGAISIEKLIDTAIQHEQKAIALTNHGTLNGLYKFNKLCNKKGIKAINGIEAYITEKRYHLILLAKNLKGYQDLLTLHNKNVEYMKNNGLKRNDKYVNGGIYYSNLEQDKELCSNLIALSGCLSGEIPTLLLNGEYEQAKNLAIKYNTLFNQFYLEIQYNGLSEQEKLNQLLIELSNDTGIPLTVTGDVHYIENKDDWNAIKEAHRKNSKAPESNNQFMTTAPEQLANTTINIADSISSYPIETSLNIPQPEHKRTWLKTYCQSRLKELNIDDFQHRQQLNKELNIIKDEIADYHILLYEIVQTIKDVSGAIGGRGSAVGSLVCYLLGFHEVDPLKYNLLFERFLNSERITKALESDNIDTSLLPDIDLNIADDKRDAVYKALENKYEYIAKVMTYSRLKADNKTIETIQKKYPTADVIDLKYNLSVHAGGVILSTKPFKEYLPITLTKDNEIVTDCSLDEVEARGGIKYDLLGESSSKINDGITIDDKEIPELIKFLVKHPIGISQFTGYSARKYLANNKITTFDDLLDATALIRTGSNETWIFQEDMMKDAVRYGISYADADYLRKPRGTPAEKEQKLNMIIDKMTNNGCTPDKATQFKEYHKAYSFNKSHAVAYTLESLKNTKLKKEHPAEFYAKKLNHVKDPISIAELFNDAIQLEVNIIPPGRKYYKLDAKADENKLYVGSKFIKGISTKEPTTRKGFIKVYKEYLKKSHVEKLYAIGCYDAKDLPADVVSIGYKKVKDKEVVATISSQGFYVKWFETSPDYKPSLAFDKGAIISDEFISLYSSG